MMDVADMILGLQDELNCLLNKLYNQPFENLRDQKHFKLCLFAT